MNEQATKHTPGPWAVRESSNPKNGAAWRDIVSTAGHFSPSYVGEAMEQDARLIAAAPDLLALAARGASLADAVAESAYDVGKHTEDIRRLAYWALDARAAIRAAEGGVER